MLTNATAKHFTLGNITTIKAITITKAKFKMFKFGNFGKHPALVLTGVDDIGFIYQHAWSACTKGECKPSKDKKYLIWTGTKFNLSKTSALAILLKSLVNAGFSAKQLYAGDCSIFKGYELIFNPIISPNRKQTWWEIQSTVPIVTYITKFPIIRGLKRRSKNV